MPHRNTEVILDPIIVIGAPSKMLQHQGESSSPHSRTQDAPLPNDAKIEMIHSGNWLSFGHVNFTDPIYKKKRQWEFVRRNRHNSSSVDAVDILATLTRKDEPESVILVAQYRPPVQKICVEFPAGIFYFLLVSKLFLGLVDPGESVYDAAKRELLEETGYSSSEVVYTSSALFYDAGLSDSNMKLVHIRVDGDSSQNVCPKSQPELDEWSMETLIFPLNNLLSSLTELHKSRGYQIDAKLFTYAYAIEMAKKMNL